MDEKNQQARHKKLSSRVVFLGIFLLVLFILALFLYKTNKKSPLSSRLTISPTAKEKSSSPVPIHTSLEPTTSFGNSCRTDSDCKNDEKCTVIGPIVANQPIKKICSPKNQINPF